MVMQLKIVKLRVKNKMNLKRYQLDEAVADQKFLVAQQIKAQMDQLEEEQLSAAKAVGAAPPPSATPAAVTPVMTVEYLDLSDSCPDLSAGQSNCHSKVSYSYAVGGHPAGPQHYL